MSNKIYTPYNFTISINTHNQKQQPDF